MILRKLKKLLKRKLQSYFKLYKYRIVPRKGTPFTKKLNVDEDENENEEKLIGNDF